MIHKNHSINERCDLTNFVSHPCSHSAPVLSSRYHTTRPWSTPTIFKILSRPVLQVRNQNPTRVRSESFLRALRALWVHQHQSSYMALGICLCVYLTQLACQDLFKNKIISNLHILSNSYRCQSGNSIYVYSLNK